MASASETDNFPNGPAGTTSLSVSNDNNTNASENLKNGLASNSNLSNNKPPVGYPNMSDHNNVANQHSGGPPPDMNNANSQPGYPPPPGREGGGGSGPQNNGHHPMDAGDPKHWGSGPGPGSITPQNSNAANPGGYDTMPYAYNRPYEPSSYMHAMPSHNNVPDIANSFPFSQYSPQAPRSPYGPVASKPMAYMNTNPRPGPGAGPPSMSSSYAPGYPPHHQPRYMGGPPAPHPPTPTLNQLLQNQRYPGPPPPGHHPPPPPSSNAYSSGPGPATDYPPKDSWMQHRMPYSQQSMYRPQDVQEPIESTNSGALNATPNLSGRGSPAPNNIAPPLGSSVSTSNNSLPPPPQPSQAQQQSQNSIATPTVVRPAPSPTGSTGSNSRSMSPAIGQGNLPMPPRPSSSQSDSSGQPPRMSQSPMATQSPYQSSMPPPPHMGVYANKMAPGHPGLSPYPPPGQYPPTGSSGAGAYMPRPPSSGYPSGGVPAGYPNQPPMGSPSQGTPSPSPGPPQPQGPGTIAPPSSAQAHPQPGGPYPNRPIQQYPPYPGPPVSQYPPQQGWGVPGPPTGLGSMPPGKGVGPPPPPPSHQQAMMGSGPPTPAQQAPRPHTPPHPYLKQHLQQKMGGYGHPPGPGPGGQPPQPPPHGHPQGQGPPPMMAFSTGMLSPNMASHGQHPPAASSPGMGGGPVTSLVTTGPDGAALDEASQQSTLSNASAASGDEAPSTPRSRKDNASGTSMPSSMSHGHAPPPPSQSQSHPTTPQSTVPSPGAASMTGSAQEDYADLNSPGNQGNWSRAPASPVFNHTTGTDPYKHKKSGSGDSLSRLYEFDDNPDRRVFLDRLLRFMEDKGAPITACPTISKNPLDLYRLYHLVRERGGFVEVTKNKAWKDIAGILGIGASSSAAYTLRKHYTKNLLPWECKYDRGGIDPQPIINQVESSTKKKGNKGISVPSPGSSNSQDSFPTGGSSAMDGYYGYPSGEYGTPMMHRGPPQQANMSENVALSNPFEDHQGGGAYSRQAMNNNYPNMYANNMPGRPPGMPSGYGPTPSQGPYYGPGPVNHEYPGQSGPIQGGPPPPPQHPPQQQHPAPPPNAAAPQLSHGPPTGPPAPQQNQAYPPAPGYPPPPRTVYPPYPTQEERMYAPPPGPPPPHPPPISAPPGSGAGPDPYGRYGGTQYSNAAGPAPGARPPPQAAPSPAPSSSPAPPNAPNPPSQQQQQPQQPPQPPPGLNQGLPQPQQSLQPPGHLPQPSSPASRPPASPAPMPPAAASPAPPTAGPPSGAGSQPPPPTLSAASSQIPTSGPGTGNAQASYPPQDVYQQDPYQRTGLRQLLASPPSQGSGNLMSMNSNNPSASSTSHTSSNKSPLVQQLADNHNAVQGYPGPIPAPGTPPSQSPFMAIQSPVKGNVPPPAGGTPRPPNPQQQPGGQPPQQQPPFAPYGQPRPAYDRGNGSGYMYGAPFNPSEAWRGGSPYGSPQYPPQGSSPGPAPPTGPQPTPPPWAQAAGPPAPPPQASSPARPMQPSQWAEQQQRYQAQQQQQQQQSSQTYPPQQGQNTWNVNMGGPMRGQGSRPPFRPDSKGYQMAPSPATKGPMGQMMSSYGVSKPVPMFPVDSIEAITPVLVKRRRLNKSDVAPVDPWRVFLALKSGLLAETTWALDTLNILLFDDSSVAYFGLNYLPGLLEVLLEHFRRTLYDMFGILEDMEWNHAASLLESKKSGGANSASQNGSGELWWQRTPVRRRGKVVVAPGEDDSSNPVEEPDSAESDMGQIRAADLVGDKTLVLEQPYAPWSARQHRSIKIVPREDDIFVSDRVKAWDVFEKKTFVVSDLVVDDLSHIRTKFDAELGLVPFVRILRGKTKNKSKAEGEVGEEETGQDSQSTLGSSSPSSAASHENSIKKPGFSLGAKRNCVKKTRSLADVLSRIKKEPLDGSSSEVLHSASAEEAAVEAIPSKSDELVTDMEIEEADQAPREEGGLAPAVLERIRDPHGVLKRRRVEEYEDECLMRDEASLYLYTDTQESLAKRCLCIATILRNLTFVPGNEASFSRNAAFLNLAGKLLLLHHEHPLRSTKQRNYDREDELDYSDSCTSLHEPEWWWDALIVLREHVLVILANISGQLDLSLYPEEIARPILDGLLHYAVCSSAQAQDPLQAYGPYSLSLVSWQRLSLEALCKLCVTEANTDLILATPPFERLEKLVALCGRSICRTEDQVLREFAINVLFYLAAADSGMAHVLAHSGNTLALLVAFIEQAEASALAVASQHGLQALREAPESMGTSLDMLRRAAHILYYVAQHPECRPLVGKLEPRLLALVMSQIMDQGVAAVLARALYLCTASPDNKC